MRHLGACAVDVVSVAVWGSRPDLPLAANDDQAHCRGDTSFVCHRRTVAGRVEFLKEGRN